MDNLLVEIRYLGIVKQVVEIPNPQGVFCEEYRREHVDDGWEAVPVPVSLQQEQSA